MEGKEEVWRGNKGVGEDVSGTVVKRTEVRVGNKEAGVNCLYSL